MKKAMQITGIVLLAAILVAVCFACAPNSLDKAKEKMDKAGYTTIFYEDSGAEECDGYFFSFSSVSNGMYAYHFTSAKAAKAYYNDLTGGEEYENLGVTGKWVYYGSKAAIKAFTK